jgi:hypothetical protein
VLTQARPACPAVSRIKTPGVSGAQSLVAPALPVMAREPRAGKDGDVGGAGEAAPIRPATGAT